MSVKLIAQRRTESQTPEPDSLQHAQKEMQLRYIHRAQDQIPLPREGEGGGQNNAATTLNLTTFILFQKTATYSSGATAYSA